ncbi:MAG: SusE domain-containing protein [Petrimonas sp.]|nr:SusE domain-containing protein [Petrimonas sp.]
MIKAISVKYIFIAICASIFIACNDTMGDPDTRLAEVKTFLEPTNEKSIVLQPSATAAVYFEWEYVNVESGGTAKYQIAFDKQDGDFSNPVYVMNSDNNGFNNNVTITHKQLNKIAGMMGILPSDEGTFKWTVFSSKGTKTIKAAQENTINITRLAGFADIPIDVYVTGEGSEGGAEISKAHKMKATAGGEFETYTKLVADKPFYFTDRLSGETRKFYTADGLVKENGTTTVPKEGVYRITLDFNTGASTYTLIERIGFFFSPENTILFDLPYIGNGVFKATKKTVTFKQEGWGRDERYKFRMFIKGNGGNGETQELEWGTLNQTDSRPNATTPESYYYLKLVNPTQWDNKWKLMGDFDGVAADYTIYLQADTPYTHSISK